MTVSTFKRFYHYLASHSSIPQDIVNILGCPKSVFPNLRAFFYVVFQTPSKHFQLKKFMERKEAEALFKQASKKEHFPFESLFSYEISHTWFIFQLQFDQTYQLRRVYLLHKDLPGGCKELSLQSVLGSFF